MTPRDRLNPYSQRFAERLFAVHPDWEYVAATEPLPNTASGYLVVDLPSAADSERRLWISTDGDEITVGFGPHGWHTHYGSWTGADEEKSFVEALDAIEGIVADRQLVATGILNGTPGASCLVAVGEDPELEGYHSVEYISWSGIHDHTIRA